MQQDCYSVTITTAYKRFIAGKGITGGAATVGAPSPFDGVPAGGGSAFFTDDRVRVGAIM